MRVDFKTFPKRWTRPKGNQFPVGTRVYKGFQGSGKTLSMVKYAFDIQRAFPKCRVYSNIIIRGLSDNYTFINNDSVLSQALSLSNGADGVLILLDEAHLFFNKKTGISLDVLAAISQQRKDRKRLVFSSQIWEELDVSLRKQVKEVVNCRCCFGHFQINTITDGESLTYDKLQGEYVAAKLYSELFKHTDELYNSYDTYQRITRNDEYHRDFATTVNSVSLIQGEPQKRRAFAARH